MELVDHSERRSTALGRTHIPQLLAGRDAAPEVDQVALLVFANRTNVEAVGGGRLMLVGDLMKEIMASACARRVERDAVPDQFPLVRTIQFCCHYAPTVESPSDHAPHAVSLIVSGGAIAASVTRS